MSFLRTCLCRYSVTKLFFPVMQLPISSPVSVTSIQVCKRHTWASFTQHFPGRSRQRMNTLSGQHMLTRVSSSLLDTSSTFITQIQNYKIKTALKKRCYGCYFVNRHGRLHVECKLKPRHKQMQQVSKKKLDWMRET